ncbi:ABC transporter permease [Butyrivibrio sp.]|uniref:ABC transporter permease n=1 Tax=Butyrivibrio sp. TaxID=28121 RepID=UPI0025C686D0|nr:FtsX-like permease family protein [Butyrivibrio sp.]MBQ9303634.1 FtsX-like permease family protein [Butyrivibrio sp.]
MIKVGDKDPKSIADMLEEYDGISAIHLSDEILDLKAALSKLYTTVVFIVIGFSIILSFMILLNLSNILVAHRMKELLTMRVNGFSNAEVIGYLVREVLVTMGLGIMLGLLIGIPATSVIIRSVESDGFMFLRKTYASAWILAVSCETLFTLIINTISFSRVNKVPLSDITKY